NGAMVVQQEQTLYKEPVTEDLCIETIPPATSITILWYISQEVDGLKTRMVCWAMPPTVRLLHLLSPMRIKPDRLLSSEKRILQVLSTCIYHIQMVSFIGMGIRPTGYKFLIWHV